MMNLFLAKRKRMWQVLAGLFIGITYSIVVSSDTKVAREANKEQAVLSSAFSPLLSLHEELYKKVVSLDIAASNYCEDKSKQGFLALQNNWYEAALAWSALVPINFGPLDEMNLVWRFQFWPDPLNLVHRKFKARVKGRNNAIDRRSLAKASVAIQGLSAIEYLLFDPAVSISKRDQSNHLCVILVNTTQNLLEQANRLVKAWQQYPNRWLKLESSKRNLEKYYSGIVMALGSITKIKLGKPLGLQLKEGEKAGALNPWLLESWRSRNSLKSIQSTLEACMAFYTLDKGLGWYLTSKENGKDLNGKDLNGKIIHGFRKSIEEISAIESSAFELVSSSDIEVLGSVHQTLQALYHDLKFKYSKVAGIQFRFNAHDGD